MAATQAQTNGEVPSYLNSATIEHLFNYPIVSDSVATIKRNDYGQMTISVGGSAYQRIGAPIVSMLSRPYQYVSPYVQKADSIGDKTLSRIDERFPAVKKPTDEIYTDFREYVLQNHYAETYLQLQHHIAELFEEEYKKAGGNGLPSMARSAVSTAFIVGSETLGRILSFLSQKKREGEGIIDGAAEKVRETIQEAKGAANEAREETKETVNDKIDGNWD